MNISESSDGSRSTASPFSNHASIVPGTGDDLSGKRGRPSKWTKSRQRKLARLYLYSTLPPKDISQALEEKESNWKPGKESTVKTVNSLLDKQPRWLRPKNREDMTEKISELTKTKKQLPSLRAPSKEPASYPQPISEAYFPPGFNETPLEYLLSMEATDPQYPPSPLTSGSSAKPNIEPMPTLYSLPFDLPFLEDSVLTQKNPPSSNEKRERSSSSQLYGYQDIARGARGIKYHTFYQCPICGQTNSHSDTYLDQMKCAFAHNRDRIGPDKDGVTPAHALVLYQRTNNDADLTPETPAQTAELYKVLFPQDDETFRRAICILDPSGNTLIHNIRSRKLFNVLQYLEELTADSSEPLFIKKPSEDDEKTFSTYLSTSSLKKRLPQYSTRYLKGITRLIKTHSISESSDTVTTRPKNRYSFATVDTSQDVTPTIRPSGLVTPPQQRVQLMLADSFLSIDRYIQRQGLCIRGFKAHDARTCLCHTLDALKSKVWVSNIGLVDSRVADPPTSLQYLNLGFRDHFGNSVLHMLAARGASFDVIFSALERGVDGNATNTSGQTFLHVMRRQILRTCAEDSDTLMWVLQKLNPYNIKLHICDVFGRSFFHLLAQQADRLKQHSLMTLQLLNIVPPSSRDAFGYVPRVLQTIAEQKEEIYSCKTTRGIINKWSPRYNISTEPREFRRPNSIIHNIPNPEILPSIGSSTNSPESVLGDLKSEQGSEVQDDNECLVLRHARLLEIARSAFTTPMIEDQEGRNGLQCLAGASLTLSIDSSQVFVKGSTNKRKADQPEPERVSSRLDLRYELVERLVSSGVSLNNYDRSGNTVLMAFVQHLKDGEDDKTLAKLFRYLIERGANIHWRDRQGEIALHIAVKLGRKVATRVLLEAGSNINARNADDLGVLAVGEKYYLKARNDPTLYASIMACMAQCIQYGAAATPTLVQEWSVKI
ncbi:putative ankyrin repeat protein [Golovinomyces cichoracearum]|uniref:Putative ankyrin repeat protein n=1 Tax=Golovinomyces cichoracearum TaxID=62708 RepID=A0A420GUX6_9PEZI|nr:putative ankyrin repeat protein [Golovinomyces cichoracearum]